jgi:hypothetical protein
MTTRLGIAAALCMLTAACGGNSGSGGNAAASKTFTYAAPTQSDGTASLVSAQLSGTLGSTSSPTADSAQGVANFSGVTSILLGSSGAALAPSSPQRALVSAKASAARALTSPGSAFDNPSCATVTATSVSMKDCTITITTTDTSGTTTETFHVDGTLSVTDANQTVTWDLTVSFNMSASASSMTLRAHEDGTLTVTATTIKGKMLSEMSVSENANGFSASFGVDESLDIDLTYTATPPCVTGGTLEAKRVWTQRPAGYTTAQLPDKGAKVTWTGCGQGTIAFSN